MHLLLPFMLVGIYSYMRSMVGQSARMQSTPIDIMRDRAGPRTLEYGGGIECQGMM